MSDNSNLGTGGAWITPSARPSIHSYRQTYQEEDMGRYGTLGYETSDLRTQPTNEEGRDEIDNVQSKFLRPSSPPRNIIQKRNSVDLPASPLYDSDERQGQSRVEPESCFIESKNTRQKLNCKLQISTVFAKSLPATLPSRSYSSDEFRWPNQSPNVSSEFLSLVNRKEHLQSSPYRSDFERSNYESVPSTPERSPNNTQSRDNHPKSQSSVVYMGILSALIAITCTLYLSDKVLSAVFSTNKYNLVNFNNDLNDLGEKYKIRDNSILQIQSGISTISERQDTGSFVLAYQSNKNNFDADLFDNLINTIAHTAARYLRNDTTEVQHIVVDGPKLEMRTHSELISKYRDDITKTGVMLVRDLDEVPSTLAMAFHYYCDEYNPLVKKTAIFFTLDMTKCSHNPVEQTPTHSQIEKCLKKKWSGVPKDNISPLLNRVVNTVIDVTGE